MNKVLVITYYWPPGSGAGVQRWLKFSKYLPSFGWEPVILTIDPGFAAYPATDNTLIDDIPPGIKVFKTAATDYFRFYKNDKSKIPSAGFATGGNDGIKGKISRFIRGNFFIPDPRRGWNRYAFMKACELIENEKIDHVITTSPPHSSQLIGLKLKRRFPIITWIADLRDPWTDIYYYSQFCHTSIAKAIDMNYEKAVLGSADKIITVGKSLRDSYSLKVKGVAEKTEIITNGFDEDDFKNLVAQKPDFFTISYIGTLSGDYPVSGFLSAFKELISGSYNVRLRFVGMVSDFQRKQICPEINSDNIEFLPYVNHRDAIGYMTGSSALLLIIPDHRSNKSILTGKLFEYLASGRPVICIGPENGDAAEIINETNAGRVFDYNDSEGIRKYIAGLIENPDSTSKDIASYSRRNLTEKLVQTITG